MNTATIKKIEVQEINHSKLIVLNTDRGFLYRYCAIERWPHLREGDTVTYTEYISYVGRYIDEITLVQERKEY
jgi:hypothetical protein